MAFVLPLQANAQDSTYTPPPMFEDMTPPMVRPDFEGDYMQQPKTSSDPDAVKPRPATVAPRLSEEPQAPAAPAIQPPVQPATPASPSFMKPIVEKPEIKREKPPVRKEDDRTVKPSVKTPAPPKKPVAPAPVKEENDLEIPPTIPTIDVPVAKEAPAPQSEPAAAPLIKEDVPKPPSAAGPVIPAVPRDPKESAITGPKTMPSLPVQSVDGQVTFDTPDAAKEPTIMERVNTPDPVAEPAVKQDDTLVPVAPSPKQGVTPAAFDEGQQNVLKKSIVFQPGQIGLVPADSDPIVAGVLTELKDKDDWRVQIKSYATPHGTGVSSDRRIALGRALSLRSSLIEQGFPAAKVDILAEGLQTDSTKPGDRIDLYLYGPKTE